MDAFYERCKKVGRDFQAFIIENKPIDDVFAQLLRGLDVELGGNGAVAWKSGESPLLLCRVRQRLRFA